MDAQSNGGQWDATVSANSNPYFPSSYPWKDSAINLGAGTYTVYYAYRNRITPGRS